MVVAIEYSGMSKTADIAMKKLFDVGAAEVDEKEGTAALEMKGCTKNG